MQDRRYKGSLGDLNMKCPKCQHNSLHPFTGIARIIHSFFGIYPYTCSRCNLRFDIQRNDMWWQATRPGILLLLFLFVWFWVLLFL